VDLETQGQNLTTLEGTIQSISTISSNRKRSYQEMRISKHICFSNSC